MLLTRKSQTNSLTQHDRRILQKCILCLAMLVCLLSCSAISSKNEYDPIDSKFWLHRVNSPKRLSLQYNKYKGFELDIIFHTEMNNEGGGKHLKILMILIIQHGMA